MTKTKLFVITLTVLCLCSCADWFREPELYVSVDRQEVGVNQPVTIQVIYDEVKNNYIKNFVLYIEGSPKDVDIAKDHGFRLCNPSFMPENSLCIVPEYYKDGKYMAKFTVCFDTVGKHVVKINGCNYAEEPLNLFWNEDLYTYTFTVTEE